MEYGNTGQKVAISTTDGERSYVGIVEVDESVNTSTQSSNQSSQGSNQGQNSQDNGQNQSEEIYFDELVGKSIDTIDVYSNVVLKNIVFSKDDAYVAVIYDNEDSVTKFKFYKVSGEIVGLNLDSIFAQNKYNLIYKDYKDNEVYFDVTGVRNADDIVESLLGSYKVSTKDFKVSKL